MSKRQYEQQQTPEPAGAPASAFESGVIPKGMAEALDPDHAPPWPVVYAYLTTGAHRAWVEAWAARSPAFADVLAALRNDEEDRKRPKRRGQVVPLKRGG